LLGKKRKASSIYMRRLSTLPELLGGIVVELAAMNDNLENVDAALGGIDGPVARIANMI
jgi:hypothetical protein